MNQRAFYKKYMTSEKWRMKRASYFANYGRGCKACGTQRSIVLHHMTYERFGNELLTDLVSLCQTCHKEIHERHRKNRRVDLKTVTLSYINKKRGR